MQSNLPHKLHCKNVCYVTLKNVVRNVNKKLLLLKNYILNYKNS